MEKKYIESGIVGFRDPCVLAEDGVYYIYGTGWKCRYNKSGRLDGEWVDPGKVVSLPPNHENDGDHWAPEVHKYKGSFYMITTYHSRKTGHRGCTVLKSESPLGPFVEISGGQITPHDWDSIDGTLYVDEGGQPWMVFVHEWTSTNDGVGRMAAAKLSENLTHFITEPIELFRADEPVWSNDKVTDGCYMYRTKKGSLLMLWSNYCPSGYCLGIARSDNGRVDGKWIQSGESFYSKEIGGEYDGGHGMVFTGFDGRLYMSLHAPNSYKSGRPESPIFIPLREENDSLVWDKL